VHISYAWLSICDARYNRPEPYLRLTTNRMVRCFFLASNWFFVLAYTRQKWKETLMTPFTKQFFSQIWWVISRHSALLAISESLEWIVDNVSSSESLKSVHKHYTFCSINGFQRIRWDEWDGGNFLQSVSRCSNLVRAVFMAPAIAWICCFALITTNWSIA